MTKDITIKGIFSATVTPTEDDKGNVNVDASEMGDSVIVAAIPADAKTVNIKAKDYAISVPDASALEGKTVTTNI